MAIRSVASDKIQDFLRQGLSAHMEQTTSFTRAEIAFAYEMQGQTMGGLTLSRIGTHFCIHLLYVDPQQRGAGVGRMLMQAAEDLAITQNMEAMFVDTMSYQAPDFYIKCGFAEVARIADFYKGYDRVFYKKHI